MDWRPWMDAFLPPLLEALPGRVAFVGIQGSFGRGEAGPESDVDLVVVLDAVGAAEQARAEALAALHAYRAALDGLWAVVERCGKRYECLGQTYLRQAGLPAAKLDPCEAPARLNACETRYAAFEKLVDGGYFDRHYR